MKKTFKSLNSVYIGVYGILTRWILILTCLAAPLKADVNILIIGNSSNNGTTAFSPAQVRTELQNILSGAVPGNVNVTLQERGSTYSLMEWYHHPYPADVETTTRWPNLRGELDTAWDYVVLIGDPYTIEKMPGVYAQGVATVAQEVARGSGETILLMPWPASTSNSTIDHYKEVVYRAGRTGGHKVAPAALAWQAAGSPVGATHPSSDGAYIAAATIYSRIYGQNASTSSYTYNDTLADTAHTTVTNNVGQPQYTGDFNFQNPFLMIGDKRREVHFSHKGTSTERGISTGVMAAMTRSNIRYNHLSYVINGGTPTYNSSTPFDDGRGWPINNPMPIAWNHGRKFAETSKQYEVNPDFWQMGVGFRYQTNTYDADVHLSQIGNNDLNLANYMISQDDSARCLPWRVLYAQILREYPTEGPLRDGLGHLSYVIEHDAIGAYLYTLYSGRCPVDPKPADPVPASWYATKVGYETAWRLGRCVSRAPGFKVMPASLNANEVDVTPTTSRTLSVSFINAPTSDVTVAVNVDDPYAGTVSTNLLTFTPLNYGEAQTISVSGLPGNAGAFPFNVSFTTSCSDLAYDGVTDSWNFVNSRNEAPFPGNIALNGNGVDILPAHTTPSTANGTDFGTVTGSVTRTFTISNTSATETLNLTNTPRVTVTDPDGYFTLSQDAPSSSLAPGVSTTFQITFNPPAGVIHTATVTVESDDDTIAAYTFEVTGARVGAPSITDHGVTPSTTTAARFRGVLVDGGITADAWICWGSKDGGTANTADWDHVTPIGTVTQGSEFSKLVTGMDENRSYYYRFYVSNAAGSSWSTSATAFHAEHSDSGTWAMVDPIVFNATTNSGVSPQQAPGLATSITYSSRVHDWDRVEDAFGGASHPNYDETAFIFANNRAPDDGDAIMGSWFSTPYTSPYGNGTTWAKESVEWIAWNTTSPVTLAGYQLDLSSARAAKLIRFSVNGVVVDTYDNGNALTNGLLNRYFEQPVTGTQFRLEVTSHNALGPLIREIDAIVPTNALRVANRAPSNISDNQATFNGKFWAPAENSTVTLHWGTTDGGTNPAAWQSSVAVGSWTNQTTDISSPLTSLLPGTRYYYTFSTTNGSTTAWSSPSWQFETTGTPTLPQIINTAGATSITATNALLQGWLTSAGGATTTVTCYWNPGSDPGETTAGWAYSKSFGTASIPTQYSHNTADDATLVAGTTYYYRYRATNSLGTSWSGAMSFTPQSTPQVGNSTGATSVSTTSANLRGSLTAGGTANAWICWGETDAGTGSINNWDHAVSLGSIVQGDVFSTLVSGLAVNTTYYYRCYVSNTVGGSWSANAVAFSATPAESTSGGGSIIIVPPPSTVTASSQFSSSYSVSKLFDATVTPADVGVTSYGITDNQYAGSGVGPHSVFMDFGSTVTADGFVYSQRPPGFNPDVDQVKKMEFWFEGNSSNGSTPTRTPDETITITNTTSSKLTAYSFGQLRSSRYVVVRLTGGTYNPGGSEFRLARASAVIQNLAPTNIAGNSATLNAQLDATASNYNVHVYYGTTDGGSNPAAWASSQSVGSWTNVSTGVSQAISSLLPGTRYYYRFRAISGSDITWASPSWQFTTTGTPGPLTYTVSYHSNGNTGGSPPDDQLKTEGIDLTLATNSGNLVNTGHTFLGWNTAADGTGTDYAAGGSYTTNAPLTLYAKWSNDPPVVDAGPNQTIAMSNNSPWTPAELTTAAWYDAADASTITASAGAVSQWNDKSGNSRNINQTTAGFQPTHASNTVSFDGIDDYLWNENPFMYDNNQIDIFVVAGIAPTTDDRLLSEGSSTSDSPLYCIAQTHNSTASIMSAYIRDNNGAALHSQSNLSATGAIDDTRKLYQWKDTGSQVSGRVNGGTETTSAYSRSGILTMDRFSMGAVLRASTVAHINADVNEMVICNNLSNADREKMEGYLAHKWGLAASLPAGHPYYSLAPGGVTSAVASLNGTVSDPDENPFTSVWSVFSGPGAVVFGNASAENTTATFSTAGTYVLRLTADDGRAQSYDDVTITVVSPPSRYLTWAAGSFANSFTLTGLYQNQDNDGMINLLEFAFGTDPTKSDSGALAIDGSANGPPVPVKSAEDTFEFYFVRRKDHGTSGSVSYTVQFSSDLGTFHDNTAPLTHVADSIEDPNYEVVKVTYPASLPDSQPARFGRIMLTPVP